MWRFYVKYYREKKKKIAVFHGKCSDELHFFYFHQLRILQLGTAMPHTQSEIILIAIIFHWEEGNSTVSSWEPLLCETDSLEEASQFTTILIPSSLGSTVIYPIYIHCHCDFGQPTWHTYPLETYLLQTSTPCPKRHYTHCISNIK